MAPSPMFPLGTVLFPGSALPLHVFEPRYREMTRECLDTDRRFGVVLIERGSEVGGGDQRSDTGTMAEILRAEEAPDGRWALLAAGVERLRVERWLDDDPFPRAEVELLVDTAPGPDIADRYERVIALMRRALALKSELGDPAVAATADFAADPVPGSYQLCAVAPVGPIDKQRLLLAAGPDDRLALVEELLDDEIPVLEARLA